MMNDTLESTPQKPRPRLRSMLVAPVRWIRRRWGISLILVILLLIGLSVFAATRPKKPQYTTTESVRADLRQTVEAVGSVTSEKALELQFPTLDIVADVQVKEGDTVKAGQTIAALRSGTLQAGIAASAASLDSAKAALKAVVEGARKEDIAIIEAQVQNKRAILDTARQTLQSAEENLKAATVKIEILKNEARVALTGTVESSDSAVEQQLSTATTALLTLRGVFGSNDVGDAIIKANPSDYQDLQAMDLSTMTVIQALRSATHSSEYQASLNRLRETRTALASTSMILARSYDLISSLPLTTYLSNAGRETHKSTIALQKGYVQSALSSIDAALQALQNASANYDTKIYSAEADLTSLRGTRDRAKADIASYETSLKIDEASLALKKAPARSSDVDAARARVKQAEADLARASAQYRDSLLVAPVDGVITKVNVKAGQVRPSTEPSITMLGTTPFRIEMFVSEVDVPAVRVGQSGSIVLDAYKKQDIPLVVREIDTSSTEKDGVPKYRVKLDIVSASGVTLRIGMTGDATIITGFRPNVVSVPLRSILDRGTGSIVRVLGKDGTVFEKPVSIGMEGEGGTTEVEGIEAGETIIVVEKK